jgi:RND family efflux transporter MFP subunit
MDPEPLRQAVRSLRTLALEAPAGLSDAQLVARFAAQRDEAAFELLLRRHGPMVLGVCRRLLGITPDAEDAFQATFLALVRKAGSLRRGAAVGGWLYHVAYRVALRLRTDRARRSGPEQDGVEQLPAPAEVTPGLQELRQILDEEISRLPARQRAAFLLCGLEGLTGAEAARQLGCAAGTVSSRLTRARERLRARLTRRGLAPALGGLTALLAEQAVAGPPPPLVETTLRSALLLAAGAPSNAVPVQLAQGVLRAMTLTKLKVAALLLLATCFVIAGGLLALQGLQAQPAQDPPKQAEAVAVDKEAPLVQVARPQRQRAVATVLHQEFTVRAADREDLYAEVPGVLKKLAVELGRRVKKNEVLAEIDSPALVLEERQAAIAVNQARGLLSEAEARVAIAKAESEVAGSTIEQRRAELDTAQAALENSERQYERLKRVYDQGTVSQTALLEVEKTLLTAKGKVPAAKAALENARAELAVQRSKVAQVEATVVTAHASLESAQLALEKAAAALHLTKITAPFDGIVTACTVQQGHRFRNGERGTPLPLLTVQRTDRLRLEITIHESIAAFVEVGDPVALDINALPGVEWTDLKITRIGYVVDPKIGGMRAEIDVPNPGAKIRPGMHGFASVYSRGPVLKVPRSAVTSRLNALGNRQVRGVYIVRSDKAHFTPIYEAPFEEEDSIPVLAGLAPDDLVVLQPNNLEDRVVPVRVQKGAAKK